MNKKKINSGELNGSQVQDQQSSENKITFSVVSPDETGLYHISLDCPEVGGLTDIGLNSTPEAIGLDAIECVANNLKLLVHMKRTKKC